MDDMSDEQVKESVRDSFATLSLALGALSDGQAAWKPEDGEWSAAQVGDHVALATGVMGNVTSLLAMGQAVTDADWDPPPQFKGNAADVGDIKRRLAELPAFTDALFHEGAQTNRLDTTADNSQLGEMNWREWFYFLGVHADDHLGQIEKLRSMPGFPG
jgi:hypothetical protein